jgi:cytochrome c-type biogenesis protein CcmH
VTAFLIGAAFLALLTTLLVSWRRSDAVRPADLDDPNLNWYRQRASELDDGAPQALLDEAQLRLVEDGLNDNSLRQVEVPARGRNPGLWILPVVLVASALLYWQLGAVEDVLIYRELQTLDAQDELALPALARRITARSAQRPDNTQYLGLLGQLQFAQENYVEAAGSFTRLADAVPNDAQAQAQAAQSQFLAAGRRLDDSARGYAERALDIDPQQGTALGLLGMAAFESGEFADAVRYWERLRSMEVEGSQGFQMLTDVIAVARERMPDSVPGEGETEPVSGLRVSLELAEGAAVPADAVVFVFARSPSAATRMPIAVRRLTAGDLPLTLSLSDADSMAGQSLSDATQVIITAQVSRNGQPGEANAVYLGRSQLVSTSRDDVEVRIQLLPLSG